MLFYLFLFLVQVNGDKMLEPLQDIPPLKIPVQNGTGLIQTILSDPKKFVENVVSLDPVAVETIVSMLEELRTTSETAEANLIAQLAARSEEAVTTGNAVVDAQAAVAHADAELAAAEGAHDDKLGEKNAAQKAHDDGVPVLQNEQDVINQVIEMLVAVKSPGKEVKINFGQPGQSQEGFIQLGVGDGSSGSFSGTFDFEGRTCTIAVGGYSHTRSNYAAVSGGDYTNLSTLLKSSFLCNQRCTISVNIGNLKPSHLYQMTTYHHSTSYPRGGAHFILKYNGNSESSLQQSANGVAPNPPLIHVEQVTSTDSGEISFTMQTDGAGGAHIDLNALEIKDM